MTNMRTRFGPVLSLIHWFTRSRALVAHGETDREARVPERIPVSAQQIKRWTGQPPPLAARSAVRRMPDGPTRDHCRSGAETLPGVLRRCTYTVVVGPWCEGYWRRIGPYRPSHASRYSACLPPSCLPLSPRQNVQWVMTITHQTSERAAVAALPPTTALSVQAATPARLVWKVTCAAHRCAAVIGFGVLLLPNHLSSCRQSKAISRNGSLISELI
jgi:hypothetical protein